MPLTNVSNQWNHLLELTKVVNQFSEQQCFKDLESVLKQIEALEAKVSEQEATIRSHDETLAAKSEEFTKLKREHKDRQEEVIESHSSLLRKRDDEKLALNQALTRHADELNEANQATQHLSEHIQILQSQLEEQGTELKKTESQLHSAHTEIENLKKSLKEHSMQVKSKEEDRQAEKKAHNESKSQVNALQKRCIDLEEQLRASNKDLKQIEELAPPLMEDNIAEVSKSVHKIWKLCFQLGQICFRDGNPLEQLRDPSRWRNLRESNVVTYAVPLVPTNSPAAKRMRFFTMLATLADSLIHNLFTSTYLFNNTEELDRLMLEMADTNQRKEALFRRLMNSMLIDMEDVLPQNRQERITEDVAGRIEPLLSAEQNEKMRSNLAEMLKLATGVWKSLQKRQSYFTVEPRPPSDTGSTWKSLAWDDDKKQFCERNTKAPQDVVLLLFPRVIMLSHDVEQEVFPGVVLQKPETAAAHLELSELPPTSPSLARAGTNRSIGGRRGNGGRRSEQDSFLAQNGT